MFEFANPWCLLGVLLPFLLWFVWPKAKSHVGCALQVPFFDALIVSMQKEAPLSFKPWHIGLLFAVWCFLILALAGPRMVGEPEPIVDEGYQIMLVLDVSGSMALTDMTLHGRAATRLAVVKKAAESFVKGRGFDKIGLILFGTRAYLMTPLTFDRKNILDRLQDATVGLAGKTTSIGEALGLAVKRLKQAPKKGRIVVLLTDGANNSGVLDPMQAASLAKEADIKVYTIGLGGGGGVPMPQMMMFGAPMQSDLDEDTLKAIAKETNGQYFQATDASSLERIYQTISTLEPSQQEQVTLRPVVEYYDWPLAAALLLFLLWLVLLNPWTWGEERKWT